MDPMATFDLCEELLPFLFSGNLGRQEMLAASTIIEAAGYSKSKRNQLIALLKASNLEARNQRERAFRDGVEWYIKLNAESNHNRINIERFSDQRGATAVSNFEISGGQQGAVGNNPHVHDVTFVQQMWDQAKAKGTADTTVLAAELAKLLAAMKNDASEPEHFESLAEVSRAEKSAKSGDGPSALQSLKAAGQWALDVATKIGVSLVTELLKPILLPGQNGR